MKNLIFVFIIPLTLLISCNKEEKINFDDSRSKIIDASEINNKLSKEKNIILRNATIIGDIDFTKSKEKYLVNANLIKHTINSALTFYDCTFKGKIIAHKKNNEFRIISEFNKSVCFVNCTFQDTVDFSYSDFKDVAIFSNSMFQNLTNFESAFFSPKGANFSKSHFIKYAKFNIIESSGYFNISDAVFDDNVLFQLSEFNRSARFASVKFNRNADFTKVKFFDDVFFNYSEFYRSIKFNTSVFRGRTEFLKCKFNMISEFKNCLFFSETKFKDAEISGILTFENSIFYISNPENFKIKLLKESDFTDDNTFILLKK
ncbi:MAG: hypothetical protein GXO80_12895 [Chlorobi bacterium]|nr:hypothetical protein [Chlorobiota bacterium]